MKTHGFSVAELLFLITVLFVVGAISWVLLDPFELKRRGNDSLRMFDLGTLQQAINKSGSDASASGALNLCANNSIPCQDKSSSTEPSVRKSDGTGWVKVDLTLQKSVGVPQLPIDPVNDNDLFFEYHSDGVGWEIDVKLESKLYHSKMISDGGDNPEKLEVGTNLTLIN